MNKGMIKNLKKTMAIYKKAANSQELQILMEKEKDQKILPTIQKLKQNLEEAYKIIEITNEKEMDDEFANFIEKMYKENIESDFEKIKEFIEKRENEKHIKMKENYLKKLDKN